MPSFLAARVLGLSCSNFAKKDKRLLAVYNIIKEKISFKASIFGPWMLFCILIKLYCIIQLDIIKFKTKNNSNTFSLKWGSNEGSKTCYIDNIAN